MNSRSCAPSVGDFSEITAWNQSNPNFVTGSCHTAWRRPHF
jgi:hypothetical protein